MMQMLSVCVAPVMSAMRLPAYHSGQWRFKGHVVCFPQDIQPVVSVLPRVSVDVLVLPSQQSANADAMREFRVSRQRVHDALLWLMEHNRYYGDISVSIKNFEQLPDDSPLQLRLDQCGQNLVALTGNAFFPAANSKPGFVMNIHSFSFGHSVLLSATHHHGESSLHVLVGLPSQVVSWFESSGWPSWWFLVLCVLVCSGPVVSFEVVLSSHTLPMVPTVCCGCSCLR